jgi:hypothetical protein
MFNVLYFLFGLAMCCAAASFMHITMRLARIFVGGPVAYLGSFGLVAVTAGYFCCWCSYQCCIMQFNVVVAVLSACCLSWGRVMNGRNWLPANWMAAEWVVYCSQ